MLDGGLEVSFRSAGKSGHPKIEIVNQGAKTFEKITFFAMNLVEKLELKISWLLDGWQLELISAEHVQQLAEKWMTETSDVIDIDQGMAVIEVLSQLDILNQQLIIQDDIPAMRQYLQQEKTNPIAASVV